MYNRNKKHEESNYLLTSANQRFPSRRNIFNNNKYDQGNLRYKGKKMLNPIRAKSSKKFTIESLNEYNDYKYENIPIKNNMPYNLTTSTDLIEKLNNYERKKKEVEIKDKNIENINSEISIIKNDIKEIKNVLNKLLKLMDGLNNSNNEFNPIINDENNIFRRRRNNDNNLMTFKARNQNEDSAAFLYMITITFNNIKNHFLKINGNTTFKDFIEKIGKSFAIKNNNDIKIHYFTLILLELKK